MPSHTDLFALRHQPQKILPTSEALANLLADDKSGPFATALIFHTPALLERTATWLSDISIPQTRAASRWVALAAAAETPELDARIDDLLDDPDLATRAIDGLVQGGALWYHDILVDRLQDDDDVFASAWLLSRSAPEKLEESLAEMDSTDRILSCLRAASLGGDPAWYESLFEWRQHFEESVDARQLQGLDAALATADPTTFARQALMGDLDIAWLSDDRAVADFLTRHGVSDWCHTLALFRQVRDPDAFELSAAFATCAALTEVFDDIDDDALATGDATSWLRDAPSATAFHLAIADDGDFAAHLVESTIHHALHQRDLQPPAMTGLPLSGPPVGTETLDEALGLFDDFDADHPRDRVALVRTMTDLVAHAHQGHLSRDVVTEVLNRFSADVDAVKCLARAFTDQRPVGRVDDWGCRGLHRLLWTSVPPSTDSLIACANTWFDGPLERTYAARAFFDATLTAIDD